MKQGGERFGRRMHFGNPRAARYLRDSAAYWRRVAAPVAERVLRLSGSPPCRCAACERRQARDVLDVRMQHGGRGRR